MPANRSTPPWYSPTPQGIRSPSAHQDKTLPLLRVLMLCLALAVLAMLLMPVVLGAGLFGYYKISDLIYPGVSVGPVDLQGMTLEEATIELHKVWNLEQRINASDGLHRWNVSPADLGLSMNAAETARAAFQVGRGYSLLGELGQVVYSLRNGWEVEPVVAFEPNQARALLQVLDLQASKPAVDASIQVEGGQVFTTPGELGYAINIDDTLTTIQESPSQVLLEGALKVALKPVPPVIPQTSVDLSEVQRFIDAEHRFRAYDPVTDETIEWTVPPETISNWLNLQPAEGGFQIGIDTNKVAEFLSSARLNLGDQRFIDTSRYSQPVAESLRVGEPVTILVSHHPTRYVVAPGDTLLEIGWRTGIPYWMIANANPSLDPDRLPVGQEIIIPSKDDLLPLPIVLGKRIVISIKQQRLWMYEDGKLLSKHPISTGIDRSPTQPGIFQVRSHTRKAYASIWDLTMPHFLGIYEAWPGFFNGIHGLPTLSNGRRLWGNILGRPASFGCIILDLKAAENLYHWAEDGVIVEIRP